MSLFWSLLKIRATTSDICFTDRQKTTPKWLMLLAAEVEQHLVTHLLNRKVQNLALNSFCLQNPIFHISNKSKSPTGKRFNTHIVLPSPACVSEREKHWCIILMPLPRFSRAHNQYIASSCLHAICTHVQKVHDVTCKWTTRPQCWMILQVSKICRLTFPWSIGINPRLTLPAGIPVPRPCKSHRILQPSSPGLWKKPNTIAPAVPKKTSHNGVLNIPNRHAQVLRLSPFLKWSDVSHLWKRRKDV